VGERERESFFKDLFIYFKERENKCGEEELKEKERETQAYTTLSVEPHIGLDLTILRSGPELKPRVGCSANGVTQMPQVSKV